MSQRWIPSNRHRDPGELVHVDKDPYYRTTAIFNKIFKKNIRLKPGTQNETDCETIWVNFGETWDRPIVVWLHEGRNAQHSMYRLECGHTWEGRAGHQVDGSETAPCWVCGSQQSYLGFEHEWQHVIFKTDIAAKALFVNQYADGLTNQIGSEVDLSRLRVFLHHVVNAFDDIRCNSLWERIYPGSAEDIWSRWKRKVQERPNDDFIAFIFRVGLGIPTDPQGGYESLRPIVEWGTDRVRYRSFAKLLLTVRVVLDRCLGAMLQGKNPLDEKHHTPQNNPAGESDEDSSQEEHGTASTAGQEEGSIEDRDKTEDSGDNRVGSQPGEQGQPQQGDGQGKPEEGDQEASAGSKDFPSSFASSLTSRASPEDKEKALSQLMQSATKIDEGESHPISNSAPSQTSVAAVALAMKANLEDEEHLDTVLSDSTDMDIDQILQQLQQAVQQSSSESKLTSDAKAIVDIIDVLPQDVVGSEILLEDSELEEVRRLRAMFFRTIGRQRANRSPDGQRIDVPALVQYKIDRSDHNVFEEDETQRGFSYSLLCDMSGSMTSLYGSVCIAAEMLKMSLKFPFVTGKLWGFRGGDYGSAVWMYRFHKDCHGYLGASMRRGTKSKRVPVCCGGITPMNTAIHVAVRDLRNQPPGVAKRLYILTDGSPLQVQTTGTIISDRALRGFVAKEIRSARQSGIQVHTLVIGDAIKEEECLQMFGPPVFWKRCKANEEIGKVLASLVRENFARYLKTRG